MAWEVVRKKTRGGAGWRPEAWKQHPCVAVNKSGITFNHQFASAYGVEKGSRLQVLIDRDNFKLGFKRASDSPEDDGAYRVQAHSGGGKSLLNVHVKAVTQTFPDRVGHVFRAMLNNGERVIEVDLNSPEK